MFNSTNEKQANFEIEDVEDYKADNMLLFNHQALVMEVLRKVTESGCHELRTGWFNEEIKPGGNIMRSYVEDTRKKYVESVKTAISILSCDFDPEAKRKINKYMDSLRKSKRDLLRKQWEWYTKLPPKSKIEFSGHIVQGFFNQDLGWYHKFLTLELEYYRAICTELHQLTKRIKFYQVPDLEV